MSSSTLQAAVCIDEVHKGTESSGYLTIVTTEDVLMDEITAKIYFEARGRMSGYKNTLAKIDVIHAPTIIKAGEENILPFTFMIDDFIESYEGENVSFTYTCEAMMHVDDEDFKKLGLNFMASIKSFLTSDKRLRTKTQFEVFDNNHTYRVKEKRYDFKLRLGYVLPIAIGVVMLVLFLALAPAYTFWYIILGVITYAAVTYVAHTYLEDTFGKLTMKLENVDAENFRCIIEKSRKFNLKEQYVFYEIIEEVEDNRGTNSSTYEQRLYASLRKEMKNFKKNAEFTFPYTSNLSYPSLKVKDVKIIWRMIITGHTSLGLQLKYVAEFKVKKDQLIPVEEEVKKLKNYEKG